MYQLGDITLPRPTRFERRPIEISTTNTALDGSLKKDIVSQREEFILTFEHLTQTQVGEILSEYNQQEARNFEVSDGDLTIASTPVHVELNERSYRTPSSEYREHMVLILREVS